MGLERRRYIQLHAQNRRKKDGSQMENDRTQVPTRLSDEEQFQTPQLFTCRMQVVRKAVYDGS